MHEIGLLISGAIAGAMACFSGAVMPTAFRALAPDQAGLLARSIFPNYYLVLAIAAAAAAMLIGFQSVAGGRILAVVAVLFMARRVLLQPRMERLRPARDSGDTAAAAEFRRLHGLSMVIELVTFAAVITAFVVAA